MQFLSDVDDDPNRCELRNCQYFELRGGSLSRRGGTVSQPSVTCWPDQSVEAGGARRMQIRSRRFSLEGKG